MAGRVTLLVACAAVAALAFAGGASGQAQDVCAAHPSDASVVCVRDQAHTVDVCDRHADGHRAYARVVTQESYPAYLSPYYDANDSQSGCSNLHFPSAVVSVAVCVQYEGCGPDRATGVPPPAQPTPVPTPAPTPAPPPPPPPPPPQGGVGLEVGLGCTPRGQRLKVKLVVRKQAGKAKPRVKRVVFFYRRPHVQRHRLVARTDRRSPYARALPIRVGPGTYRVHARVYYKRKGGTKLRRRTASRRFRVCQ